MKINDKEIIQHLKNRGAVRRQLWPEYQHVRRGNGILTFITKKPTSMTYTGYIPELTDLEATDWVIIPEE